MLKRKLLAFSELLQDKLGVAENKYKRERAAAEYIMISRPTAGRTWLRVMIGNVMKLSSMDSALDDINPINLYYIHQLCPDLPSIKPVHELNIFEDEEFCKQKKVLLMTRDPRDHIISYWKKKQRAQSTKEKDTDFSWYLRNNPRFEQMIKLYDFWSKNKHLPKDFAIVRYEDLLVDTYSELEQVCHFFGLKPTPEMLERSIELASFRKMKKMDNIGASHKVRQGRSGFYKEVLSDEDLDFIEQQLSQRLDPSYGYSYFTQRDGTN